MWWDSRQLKQNCVLAWTAAVCKSESISVLHLLNVNCLLSLKDLILFLSVLRIHFHKGHPDPLGWTRKSSFTVQQFTTRDITRLVQNTPHAKASVLVVDSLSFVLRHHQPVVICQRLQELKKGERITPETLSYWCVSFITAHWAVVLMLFSFSIDHQV